MTSGKLLIIITYLSFAVNGYSQGSNSIVKDTVPINTIDQRYQTPVISFDEYFYLLKNNFAQQASTPLHLTGKDFWKMGGFALALGGTFNYDESINHQVLMLNNRSSAIPAISPVVTKFGGTYEIYTIGAIGACGYILKDRKLVNTTLLATQAYITSVAWANVIKFVTGRSRPTYFDIHTQEDESYWHGMLFQFKKNSVGQRPAGFEFTSFPSGHTTAAFSVATVYAQLYKDKPWVAFLAYGSASLVGISRITENKHWTSDVLAGAALGYLCGTQVVRNFHRFEKEHVVGSRNRNKIEYNIGYANKSISTRLTYTFR